jgi:hypothetical protein
MANARDLLGLAGMRRTGHRVAPRHTQAMGPHPGIRLLQRGDGISVVLFGAILAVIHVRHGLPLPADFCPAFGYDLVMMAFWGCTSRWAMVAAFRTFFETAPNAAARACGLLLSFVSGLVFYIWYIRATVFSDPPPPFGDAMLSASAPAMIRLACMGFRCGAG